MNKFFERYDSTIKPPLENIFEDKTLSASPELMDIIQKNHVVQEALLRIKEICGDAEIRHLIGTAKLMLTALESEDMHILSSDQKLLLESALVHDVGKAYILQEILHKPDKLSEEEQLVVDEHIKKGESFLKEKGEAELAEIVVRHHQMKGKYRSGGERRKKVETVEIDNRDKNNPERRVPKPEYDRLARLLSIADIFESMGNRSYNKGVLPMETYLARKKELVGFDSPEEKIMIAILEKNDPGMILEKATKKDAEYFSANDVY